MPRNARKNRSQHVLDVTPSPPVPLPTPLPDDINPHILAPDPIVASTVLDHLIHFDHQEEEEEHHHYYHHLDNEPAAAIHYYRSPPFKEAQLPPSPPPNRPDTPPPLPIPPRIYKEEGEATETPYVTSSGHTRTPTLPRSPTRLESISRTIKTYAPPASMLKSSASAALRSSAGAIRTYVPSSIQIPSAGPSPPLVSRPVSFGRFSVDPELDKQRSPHLQYDYHPTPFDIPTTDGLASYPRSEENTAAHADAIAWAHWDVLSQRRILIIGYTSGVQIWDCHDLGSVTEILNLHLSSEDWTLDVVAGCSSFVHAAVLPVSRASVPPPGDLLASHRPLLGILMNADGGSSSSNHSAFFVYSLKTHQIVRRLALPGIATTFESNEHFIVISTSSIHIFSAVSFHAMWTVDSASLASTISIEQQPPSPPRHIFALSHRLLAYASPSPPHQQQQRRVSTSSTTTTTTSSSASSSSPFGFTQSDFGNAAMKVGGTVLSGMKFWGGIAYEAAKNRIADAGGAQVSGNRFFSRSAPTDGRPFTADAVVIANQPPAESGFYVTVLDLAPLWDDSTSAHPVKVAEFKTSRTQSVAQLTFSHDGCQLVVVPENGQVIRVFGIRPGGIGLDGSPSLSLSSTLVYELRRGRTSALVENVDCAKDGRWLAIGTKNRTLHIFPTNPYGGRPDLSSHLDGRVKNADELQPPKVEVTPLVRIRPVHSPKPEQPRAPLAFVFVRPGDVHLPSSLLPPILPKHADAAGSPPISPHRLSRVSNVQDVLVFDPIDGMLSLRRVHIDQRPKDQIGATVSASLSRTSAIGAVSRSLPGGGGGSPGRLSASPGALSRTSSTSTGVGGLVQGEVTMELVGREQIVATWNLQRKRDWEDIRKTVALETASNEVLGSDWLAQAELSTCSRSPRILPRAIYLSHQFTFWTLGEDYHALLRQYHFDVRGAKIHVHREVQVSIGVGLNNTSDRFVDDLGASHGVNSPFDEPLASALSGDLGGYASSVPNILPMYPNGVSGGSYKPAFIRNSIPIRRFGDGMSEGLGRIRKEISSSYHRRIRSPSLGPHRGGDGDVISVPLEFDEEDEDFLGVADSAGAARSGGSAESATSIVTPGTSSSDGPHNNSAAVAPIAASDGDGVWTGWESREVKQTVDEMEKFDDISVLGFLDEEHQREKEARARAETQQKERTRKGRRHKKAASQGI